MERQNSRGGIRAYWREKRPLLSKLRATGGFAATVLFALYNGALGAWHASLWHGSICVYYVLLSLLRGILLTAGRTAPASRRKRIFFLTSGLMLLMNMALAIPVSLMVLDQRPIQMGLIPAIASAAYTTYKISAAAVKLRQTGGTVLDRELGVLRLADALTSVLVLQNTLIVVEEGGIPPRMFLLTTVSSGGIFLLIFVISVVWFVRALRDV